MSWKLQGKPGTKEDSQVEVRNARRLVHRGRFNIKIHLFKTDILLFNKADQKLHFT